MLRGPFSSHRPQLNNTRARNYIKGAFSKSPQRDNIALAPAPKHDIVSVCIPLVGKEAWRAAGVAAGVSRVHVRFKEIRSGGIPF